MTNAPPRVCVHPIRYLQKQRTADGALKGLLVHLGEIPVPVKVTGQKHIHLIQTEVVQMSIRPACADITLIVGLSLFIFFNFGSDS